MSYVQRIVPADCPMLQLPKGYDVVSYRVEHVSTEENPLPIGKFELPYLPFAPGEYLKEYSSGLKTAPFVKIYRTIAKHAVVEKALQNGASKLQLFKNPAALKGAYEEVCYASFWDSWVDPQIPEIFEIGLTGITFNYMEESAVRLAKFRRDQDRCRKILDKRKGHKVNKFIRKCLATDDFLSKAEDYFNDPADFYREEVFEAAETFDCIFWRHLDEKLPEGFKDKTSGLTKLKIAEIISVVEVLKWQVGINEEFEKEILEKPFESEGVLWNSERNKDVFYEKEIKYIRKQIVRDFIDLGRKSDSQGDEKKSLRDAFEANPHKSGRDPDVSYFNETDAEREIRIFGDIRKNYGVKKNDEVSKFIREILSIIDFDDMSILEGDFLWTFIEEWAREFNKKFVEGFLMKNLEKFPEFLKERLTDTDNYPGTVIYMFDDIRNTHPFQNSPLNPIGFREYYEIKCLFNIFRKDNFCPIRLIFDLVYLITYAEAIKSAGESERRELTVSEGLEKMQEADPKSGIASRFLAELVYRKINPRSLPKLWYFQMKSAERKKKTSPHYRDETAHAFKLYRKALMEVRSATTPIYARNLQTNSGKTLSLHEEVSEWLLGKMANCSLIPFNMEFGKEAALSNADIVKYVQLLNEDANQTWNKLISGAPVTDNELRRFSSFCLRIRNVAKRLNKYK